MYYKLILEATNSIKILFVASLEELLVLIYRSGLMGNSYIFFLDTPIRLLIFPCCAIKYNPLVSRLERVSISASK